LWQKLAVSVFDNPENQFFLHRRLVHDNLQNRWYYKNIQERLFEQNYNDRNDRKNGLDRLSHFTCN
jgi:hypothetical protein